MLSAITFKIKLTPSLGLIIYLLDSVSKSNQKLIAKIS